MQRDRNFQSLALSDLLEARAHYHVHLTNKANVIGTAVGLYLIRNEGVPHEAARTLANSGVRDDSWPCVLVMVDKWQERATFGDDALHDFIPPTLYMPDGRTIPVCVVEVQPSAPAPVGAAWRYTQSTFGPGAQLSSEVQGRLHIGTAGCLVTDGRITYVLTNRHVAGGPDRISATLGTTSREIGTSSNLSVAKRPFHAVYPAFPDDRALLNLDAGLVQLDDLDGWRPDNVGLGAIGPLFDLNEYNIGVRLIDMDVVGFGAVTGRLEGRIKALFYRYKSVGGYDYVSDFLIQPSSDAVQAHPGDSGAVWHVPTTVDGKTLYQPLAMEWGGQGVHGQDARTTNFSLATSLSAVLTTFDVDLITSGSTDAAPFWGAMGHYAIGQLATTLLTSAGLKALVEANADRLTPPLGEIEAKHYQSSDFVPLCDVPDLVWKHVGPQKLCNNRPGLPGGRDYSCNTGPEHPNHFADVDIVENGTTFLEKCTAGQAQVTEQDWLAYYTRNQHTEPVSQGCLPFRCKQIFNAMLDALQRQDLLTFLCAAGVLAHYIGDACQPLHCSQYADGDKNRDAVAKPDGTPKSWYGKGVHSTYEDGMVEMYPDKLFEKVQGHLADRQINPNETSGDNAAVRCVLVMSFAFGKIQPMQIVDAYAQLGGGTSKPVRQGLYDKFVEPTAEVMAEGARALAELWEAAWRVGGKGEALAGQVRQFSEDEVSAVYNNHDFVKSMTLKEMIALQAAGNVLK